MPAKKKSATVKKKTGLKKTNTKNVRTPEAKNKVKQDPAEVPSSGRMVFNQIMPYILICLVIFILVCYFFTTASGIVGKGLRNLLYGLFSGGAVAVPLIILNFAFFWRRDAEKSVFRYRFLFSFVCLIFISALIHVFTSGGETFEVKNLWDNGLDWKGGGVIGGLLGVLMLKGIGTAGALIISFSMLIIFGLYLFGLTPYSIAVFIAYHAHEYKERMSKKPRPERLPAKTVKKELPAAYEPEAVVNKRMKVDIDIPIDEDYDPAENFYDDQLFDAENDDDIESAEDAGESVCEIIKPEKKPVRRKLAEDIEGEFTPNETIQEQDDLIDDSILKKFTSEENGNAGSETANTEAELAPETERRKTPNAPDANAEPVYVFPPLTILKLDASPKNNDLTEELQTTAKKLVDTLNSFKVRTKIVDISRGPTITRYELAPEEGVRVKAIANLVDDISLNLATSGVRIEAPIPGKAAVGIEVPNRVVATVYLRELLENPKFKTAQSNITVALGVDVAGEPICIDVSKMPHLLIAGATGMGKSICINSIIVSLLYKSTPKEVRLILVDPKKVELNIYNGLPHLLVPVVSDPKKAAGSLYWAVTEMERRFELIESTGVRDLKNYNLAVADNPEYEVLPQIVIIIDELADLMMTAPDDVEESICRLAQKARAAGMHLIIATQRPSVDVITGLIKANIPSRIAFTVASQTDSRVILDITGAEKLMGRGDMLYAPVGASKPVRVQGAYVSEQESEQVIDFIKRQGHDVNYDDKVIESISRAAEECGQPNKKGAVSSLNDDEGGRDPMLNEAIKLAVESDKISTSLIQRRLSLGFGRAAKLIDIMEEMKIVGPPEGQKPRKVLITKQQYMEMVLNRDELY